MDLELDKLDGELFGVVLVLSNDFDGVLVRVYIQKLDLHSKC